MLPENRPSIGDDSIWDVTQVIPSNSERNPPPSNEGGGKRKAGRRSRPPRHGAREQDERSHENSLPSAVEIGDSDMGTNDKPVGNIGKAIREAAGVAVETDNKPAVTMNGRAIDRNENNRRGRQDQRHGRGNQARESAKNCPVDGIFPMNSRRTICASCEPRFDKERERRVELIIAGESTKSLKEGAWALAQVDVKVLQEKCKTAESWYVQAFTEVVFNPMQEAGQALRLDILESGKPRIKYVEGSDFTDKDLREIEGRFRDAELLKNAWAEVKRTQGQLASVEDLLDQEFEPDSELSEREKQYAKLKSRVRILVGDKQLSKAQQLEALQEAVEEVVGEKFEDDYLDPDKPRRRKDQIWGRLNKHAQDLVKQQSATDEAATATAEASKAASKEVVEETDVAPTPLEEMKVEALMEIVNDEDIKTTAKTVPGLAKAINKHRADASTQPFD